MRNLPWYRIAGISFSAILCCLAVILWFIGKETKIIVEWSTASEFNTSGFNIYRGTSAEQIDQKVNQHIIPASTDPTSGGQYEFVDNTVVPGKQYYYIVEEVDNGGNITRFGPISILASQSKIYSIYLPTVFFVLGCAGIIIGFLNLGKTTNQAVLKE